ncbi:MAG: tetratricopeptide repeat protein [Deltaproteobacteria bacterium]
MAGLGYWDQAAEIYGQQGAESLESLRTWAVALMHQQRWRDALEPLERLHALVSNDPDVLHKLAVCYRHTGRFEDAERAARELAALPGQAANGYLALALSHGRQKNFKRATAAWREVLERTPAATGLRLPPAVVFLECGRAFLAAGLAPEAIEYLNRSVELNPTVEARTILGEASELSGDVARAEALWQSVVAEDPANFQAREGLARTALQGGAAASAVKWLQPLTREPETTSSTAYLLQRAYSLLGDQQQASRWQARARKLRERERRLNVIDFELQQSPDSVLSRTARVHRLARQGNLGEARHILESLLKEAPDDPFVRQLADAMQKNTPLPPLEEAVKSAN